jgi:uroporphyrinogen decarboxylase
VFDSWAGELSAADYRIFSFPFNQMISSMVKAKLQELGIPKVPMTLFAKGANWALEEMAEVGGYDILGLDWVHEPALARHRVGSRVALQGNLDPNVLYGGRDAIEREVKKMVEGFKINDQVVGWIASLGHGITPGVDPDDLKWFLECVHRYSASPA